jgi:hypothetical protein
MWEDDYFDEVLEPFKWEHKKRKEKKKWKLKSKTQ